MSNEPILRDAETKDMKSIIYLTERLIEHEMNFGNVQLIEDLQERKAITVELIARSLVDPDQHVWVVEKTSRIFGVFIVRKQERLTIEAHNPICVFTHAYNRKTIISFYEIHNRVKEWAKEKGCKAIAMTAITGNEKIEKLSESLGYAKTASIYELEV